jgi:hypothetical protein
VQKPTPGVGFFYARLALPARVIPAFCIPNPVLSPIFPVIYLVCARKRPPVQGLNRSFYALKSEKSRLLKQRNFLPL